MRYVLDEPATGGKLLLTVGEPRAERSACRDPREALLAIAWNRGPAQTVQVDGEMWGETPITVRVVPQAVRVIVPATATPRS